MTPTIAHPAGAALLHQDTNWATYDDARHLVRVRLDDMTPDHRRRALAWCREHAAFLHHRELDTLARLHRRGSLSTEQWAAEDRALRAVTPDEWLDTTPLVRRLVQLTPREPAPVRRRRLLPARWFR